MLEWLKTINVSAHNSLAEASQHLTTIHKLQVPVELRKALTSTNAIESMFSTGPRKIFKNVKRWKNSEQRQRYLALGLIEAQKRFRKLKGYQMIPAWLEEKSFDSNRMMG